MAAREHWCNSKNTFWILFGLSQFTGLTAIGLLSLWNCVLDGGYKWNGSTKEFAIHPLVMIISMIYLYGFGTIVERVFCTLQPTTTRIAQTVLMAITFLLAIFGVVTVFLFHHQLSMHNMTTVHSWFGIFALAMFSLQFFVGLSVLLWSATNATIADIYNPIHRFLSFAILTLVLASVVSGVMDDLLGLIGKHKYHLNKHAIFLNVIALLCSFYVIIIMYLLFRDDWKQGVGPTNPSQISSDIPYIAMEESSQPVAETSGPGELEKLLPH